MEIKYRSQLGLLLEHFGLKGDAVEIGVAEGRNAQVLITQTSITKLYMIDYWGNLNQSGDGGFPQSWHDKNYKEALQRTKNHLEKRVILKGLSGEMIKQISDDSLVLAYIDGDHSFQGCLNDLNAIYPKVKTGGIISGHDVLNKDYVVGDALKVFISENGYLESDIHYTEENGDLNMVSFWFVKK